MLDFERLCRTCMKTNNEVGLINLFGPLKIEDNCSLKLADVLKDTITLQIDEGDGLPQNVCNECLKNLQIMYTFRAQALNSEIELKKIASTCAIKNETELEVKYESDFDYTHSYEDFIYEYDTHTAKVEADDNLSMYICNVCNKKFTKRERFLKHLSNHENPKFPCSLCKRIFKKQASLQRHLDKRHNDNISDPSLTNSILNDAVGDLGVKVEIDSINEHYQCSECGMTFDNQQSMLQHFKEHTQFNSDLQQVYSCIKCLISYPTQQQLKKHMENHNNDKKHGDLLIMKSESKQYECPECHIVFENQRSLGSHLKKHKVKMNIKTEGAYYCGHCNKGFGLKTLLRRHVKLHFDDRPFHCTKCPSSYTRHDQLVMHLSKHNGIRKYACSQCEKAFTQLCSLKDHERTHTGETPFLCSQCGKGFSNSSNLRQHLKRHSGLKPFTCNLCPKSFCTKGQMKSHMDTHAGVHPYKCDVCGASFTKPNSLKKHSLIHLGIKPFACDNCAMRFSSKDHLKRHQRIHTGEKPYRCPHCPRAFTQSNDLVKHVRTHLGQNIYQCTVCQAKFRLMRELKRHYPVHYINGVDPNPVEQIEAPLVILKECEQDIDNNVPTDGQITITFNSNVLDKNSIGDITINIEPGKISN